MRHYAYVGAELELFTGTRQWKNYWKAQIDPFVRGHVLEVGAGIGANTVLLCDASRHHWTCLEPDRSLAARLSDAVAVASLQSAVRVIVGTTSDLSPAPSFDSILYVDVLEHIADDRGELQRAAVLLRPGGHLIVLAPAHQFLFSAFDRSIGHHRRYSRKGLVGLAPPALALERVANIDAVGLLASLANRIGLRQSLPTISQVHFWDRNLVPISRIVDRVLGSTAGKSLVAVWTRSGAS